LALRVGRKIPGWLSFDDASANDKGTLRNLCSLAYELPLRRGSEN
jgi:hypothetical protein